MTPKRIGVVIGTRPEAIKIAPLIAQLQLSDILEPIVILSGQHDQVVRDVLDDFGLGYGGPLIEGRQSPSLNQLGASLLRALDAEFSRQRLDMVVVHGDTATAFTAGLAAYWLGIPVAHLEAGLRTGSMNAPFPEEFHRAAIDLYADVCLAPTAFAAEKLFAEGVARDRVYITGNTVVDALHTILETAAPSTLPAVRDALDFPGPLVLVTAHRRESWGEPMTRILEAVRSVAQRLPDVHFAFAMHPNPALQAAVDTELGDTFNIELLPPLAYQDIARLLDRSDLVLTDSGGIQEEACSLGTRTLVLRDTTERPEAIDAGIATLVGSNFSRIVNLALRELTGLGSKPSSSNVFGDGHAAARCVAAIGHSFGLADRPETFTPEVIIDLARAS